MRSYLPEITIRIKKNNCDKKNVAVDEAIQIEKYSTLVGEIAELSYKNRDVMLFFRGQTDDKKNRNGSSTFYPNIYRKDYLKRSDIEYKFNILENASKQLINLFQSNEIEGRFELKRKKAIQWSILQHYEICETPLLDITHSIRVACSFALDENINDFGYFYVFGLPYMTNRISNNSEHDILNVRLLSIMPPLAKRPFFQEGYLVGTTDITSDYDDKTELDLKQRLVAKYKIPKDDNFWDNGENTISHKFLYPENDEIKNLCKEIELNVSKDFYEGDIGEFIKNWNKLEKMINIEDENMTNNMLLNKLYNNNKINNKTYNEMQEIRKFRNNLIHKMEIEDINKLNIYREKINNILNEISGT